MSVNSESVGSLKPENKQSESKRKISRYRNNNRRKIQRQNESPEEKKARLEKRQLQTKRKMNLSNKGRIDLLQQEIIMTGEEFKNKMSLLKKKKPGLKNNNFKGKVQRKMNI